MNEPGQSSVTIVDVAREAGVSYSTVSRVVNHFPFVKPETRARVEAAMEKLGYVANLKARSLAGGRSQVVGLLVYELNSSYNVEIIRGVDTAVTDFDYDLMLSTTHRRRQKETIYVKQLMQGVVDGLLIVLPRGLDMYLPELQRQHFPYVLIDYDGGDCDSNAIITTNWQGSYDAAHYLITLGHRRIGMVTGTMEIASAQQRVAGFRAAMADVGLPLDEAWIVGGDFLEQSGYEGGQRLLGLVERPTAVLAASDLAAFGVIRAAQDAGLRVPEELSVVGFDDIPEAGYMRPRLTTVRQPLQEMGRRATQLLLACIEAPDRPTEQIQLPTVLVVRESTAVVWAGGET